MRQTTKWMMGLGALMMMGSMGCTPVEEKIRRVFQENIDQCKTSKDEWVEITYLKDEKTMVLREACELKLEAVTMPDQLHGEAKMGPYTWEAGEDDKLGVWVLTNVKWPEAERAHRVLKEDDPSKDSLARAEEDLKKAQEQWPESKWVRMARLENILALRAKSRKYADKDVSIGKNAKAVFDGTLTWAMGTKDANLIAKTKLLVVDHLKKYANRLETGLESLGSGDDVLEKLIEEGTKTKNKAMVEKYTKELEERQAKRLEDEKFLTQKRADVQKLLCKEIQGISSNGVTDEAASSKIVALKTGTKCT